MGSREPAPRGNRNKGIMRCAVCEDWFTPLKFSQYSCSEGCSAALHKWLQCPRRIARCEWCDREFIASGSREKRFCTKRCADRAKDARKRRKPCKGCGKPMPIRKGRWLYCSDTCQQTQKCKGCGEDFQAPGRWYCTDECRERARWRRRAKRKQERQSGERTTFVYFIQAGHDGPIKIGIADDPEQRVRELQTGNPFRLEIRRVVPGGVGGEQALHALFAHVQLEGEWFAPVPELLALLQ